MYHTKPNSRGVYQSDRLVDNRLIAMAAEGTSPSDLASALNERTQYKRDAEVLQSKVNELERELALHIQFKPLIDGIIGLASKGPFA